MSKKNRPTDSGGSWMDTYGDMVTLLLTFFIMLYSMSNLDAQKWTIFVKNLKYFLKAISQKLKWSFFIFKIQFYHFIYRKNALSHRATTRQRFLLSILIYV